METVDIIVPAAVVGICFLIILITLWVKRDRTPKWSIDMPLEETPEPATVEPVDLAQWHKQHGATVAKWIGTHEAILRRLGNSGLALDRTDTSSVEHSIESLENFKEATAAHPSPVMRAELSAMQVAADTALSSVQRANYEQAKSHHVTYVNYRDEWVARLRQFALDDPSLVDLRKTLSESSALSGIQPKG